MTSPCRDARLSPSRPAGMPPLATSPGRSSIDKPPRAPVTASPAPAPHAAQPARYTTGHAPSASPTMTGGLYGRSNSATCAEDIRQFRVPPAGASDGATLPSPMVSRAAGAGRDVSPPSSSPFPPRSGSVTYEVTRHSPSPPPFTPPSQHANHQQQQQQEQQGPSFYLFTANGRVFTAEKGQTTPQPPSPPPTAGTTGWGPEKSTGAGAAAATPPPSVLPHPPSKSTTPPAGEKTKAWAEAQESDGDEEEELYRLKTLLRTQSARLKERLELSRRESNAQSPPAPLAASGIGSAAMSVLTPMATADGACRSSAAASTPPKSGAPPLTPPPPPSLSFPVSYPTARPAIHGDSVDDDDDDDDVDHIPGVLPSLNRRTTATPRTAAGAALIGGGGGGDDDEADGDNRHTSAPFSRPLSQPQSVLFQASPPVASEPHGAGGGRAGAGRPTPILQPSRSFLRSPPSPGKIPASFRLAETATRVSAERVDGVHPAFPYNEIEEATTTTATVSKGARYFAAPGALRPIGSFLMGGRSVTSSSATNSNYCNDGFTFADDDEHHELTLFGDSGLHETAPSKGGDDGGEEDELYELTQEMEVRQLRIGRRNDELRRRWQEPSGGGGARPAILPDNPPVFSAVTEEEIREKADAAESFAENHSKWRQRNTTNPRSTRQSVTQRFSSLTFTPTDPDERAAMTGQQNPLTDGEGDDDGDGDAGAATTGVQKTESSRPSRVEPREFNERSMASLTMGRMSMCSSSMARVTDGALAVMEMLANRPDVILPSPSETTVVRTGDVLSAKHILKLDLQDALHARHGSTGIISGAPYFRMVPKLNIAGVAQANMSAIQTIINELRRAHVEGPIIWVNLREEPLVYINTAAHIVRERFDPLKPIIIPNVTGRGIEAIEMKLKQEVLQEAYENGGNISVHVEGLEGLMEDQWECVDPQQVFTMAEVFRRIARTTPSPEVQYYRRPITQNVGPKPEDFDFVLDACLEEPKAVLVFNCQTGRGRSSAMMQIASIVRFYQLCVKDISADVRVLRGQNQGPTFRTIQKLVSLFPDGKLHERRLVILMDLADKVYSMADHINEAFATMDDQPELATLRLQQYAFFLVFSYYCEQRLWNYATKASFSTWLEENPDMKLLITGLRDKLAEQLKEERILAPVARGAEAEAARIIRHRRGNVLSAGRILCSLPMEKNTYTMRALRQLAPDVPIFTCGRIGGMAREDLVREVREAFPNHNKLHWLSLRAEPMVVINDVSYTLTDYNASVNGAENGTTMHVSLQAIEQIEDRLRRDVLLEAQEHGGSITLHRLDGSGQRIMEQVKVCSVRTPRSTMEGFVQGNAIDYYRVPIPFSGQMLASDIDPLLRYFSECNFEPNDIIVINDSEGTVRSTVALNILTLYRASRQADLRLIQSTNDFIEILRVADTGHIIPSARIASSVAAPNEQLPEHPVEVLLASTICQMLTAGTLLGTVDAAISLGGRGPSWNILHALDALKARIGVVGLNKPQCVVDALHGLRCYLLVLLSSLYLDDQGDFTPDLTFSQWIAARSEVSNIIDTLESRGEAALKYVTHDNLMKADVSRRCGDVLTANFCLKADHFPGCQKKGLRPELCGAPNFRKVSFVNVFGVAIPTMMGVHNILALLGASGEALQTYPGQQNDPELFLGFAAPRLFDPTFKAEELRKPLRGSVVWVNLREEPILYVGDRPFVFRDLSAPYVNVELTGIQTEKIEHVEEQLKQDVLNEADQYDGKFLVHDEGNPGELVGSWEAASDQTVKTLREVYTDLEAKGFRCQMLRMPVTDEQSPDISDFDLLVASLLPRIAEHLDRRETLSFVFNCQMGRGRTTTGMVICCLLIGLVIPEYYTELTDTFNPLYKPDETELGRGEYAVIVQLKRVLAQGRAAKQKVDLVLEACSKMQNLRTAIEGFVTTVSSPDTTEAGRARAHHAGVHYLVRYFNLIVFAVYLEEEYDRMRRRMQRTFVDWMASHPELTSLSASAALK